LRETNRAVTPFGGLAVFVEYLKTIGYAAKLSQHMANPLFYLDLTPLFTIKYFPSFSLIFALLWTPYGHHGSAAVELVLRQKTTLTP
jgi:hypothetical protein